MARGVRAERLWNQQTPRLGTQSAMWPEGAADPRSHRLLVCKGGRRAPASGGWAGR